MHPDSSKSQTETVSIPVEPFKANGKLEQLRQSDDERANVGRFRHVIAILALSSIVLANMNRQAYNQAITRMVRTLPEPAPNLENLDANITATIDKQLEGATIVGDEAGGTSVVEEADGRLPSKVPDDEEDRFFWTTSEISTLQAAFNYGYAPFMIPGGRLSEIYGAKWVVFLSGFGSALCSMLTPYFADNSFVLLVSARVIMGICQTGVSPALYALLTRWLPPEESSVYLAMIKVGVMIGFMFGSLLNSWLPWRPMFYLVGLIGILWSLMWTFCVSSTPEEHSFLGKSELTFINTGLRQHASEAGIKNKVQSEEKGNDGIKDDEKKSIIKSLVEFCSFFKTLLSNPVVLAFTLTKFTVKLSTDAQSILIPMYLAKAFRVSDKLNGVLNGINFFLQAVFTGLVAYSAKELIVRKAFGFSKTTVRRIYQGINNFGMAFAYLLISLNGGSLNLVCGAFILLSITSMFGSGGEAVLPVDLTTEYSASIMSIANCVANFSGIILPKIVALLLNGQIGSHLHWNYVWWFVCGTMISGGLLFMFFVKAKVQDFKFDKPTREKEIFKGLEVDYPHMTKGPTTLTSFKRLSVVE